MGVPGDKNQSKTSNIFKRVPNANYESTEAIVPGIGGMHEQSSEDVYMSDVNKSPLQQQEKPAKTEGASPVGKTKPKGPKPGVGQATKGKY